MTARRLPKYCSEFTDRHGKVRVRFRRKGFETYYFRALAWSPEFMGEYASCMAGKAAPRIDPGAPRAKPGTINALVAAYYRSPEFLGVGEGTKKTYRSIIERFRTRFGDNPVAELRRAHIKAIIGAMHETPSAANHLLGRLKALMSFAVDQELRRDDPSVGVKGFKEGGEGFHTWTEEEIAQFERCHPIGTKARLAMGLMLYTAQRRSDAVRMGPQHVVGRRIRVRQQKTKSMLEIPMHPELLKILGTTPVEHLTYLVTGFGKPFTSNGFGNWFRERCDEAQLPQCSAHGLRKAASRRLAEAGCSHAEIKAITGHKTDKEVSLYIAAASQVRLGDRAIATLRAAEKEQEMANRLPGSQIRRRKSLKPTGD